MSDYSIYNGAYTGPEVDAAIARARAGGQIDQNITALRAAVGSPLKASTVAGMTDHSRVYVYTGTETGYTAGHWYFWNGTAWEDGGVYNAVAFDTDNTLSIPGEAADAAAVGAAIKGVEDIIAPAYDPAQTYAVGDYCIYSGNMYRCKTAITTAESWTAAHWAAVQVMPEQATAIGDLKSALSAEDTTVNNALSYVNYDYDTPYYQESDPSGSWRQKIGIKRNQTVVILNAPTISYAVRLKLSGAVDLAANTTGVQAWTTGIALKVGHTYCGRTELISGESVYDGASQVPAMMICKAGTSTSLGTYSYSDDKLTAERVFTVPEDAQYNLMLYLENYTLTNAKILVVFEDLTESDMYNAQKDIADAKESIALLDDMARKIAERIGLDTDITGQFSFADGGRVRYDTGAVQTSASFSGTSYSNAVQIDAYDKITISMIMNTAASASSVSGLAFYDDNNVYVSGVQHGTDYDAESSAPFLNEVDVPDGAKYVRVTWFLSDNEYYAEFSCVGTINGEVVEENVLPDYYFANGYIDGLVKTINDNNKVMGMRNYTFFFFSDPHFYHMPNGTLFNGMNGVALMKYIGDRTNIRKIICGGDLTSGGEITNDMLVSFLEKVLLYLSPLWDKCYMVYGNHEWNNTGSDVSPWNDEERMTSTQIYNLLVKDKEREFGALQIGTSKINAYGSYWIDDPAQKIRVFYLPCDAGNIITERELLWIGEQFEFIPDGYALAVVSHVGINYSAGSVVYTGRFDFVAGMMDALKTQSTYTYVRPPKPGEQPYEKTFDYSNTDVTVVGAFTGHTHIDMSTTTTEGIPVIGITCDRGPTGKTSSAFNAARKIGTIREQAIDCVQIDLDNRKIYTTRIGGSWAYDPDTGTSGPMENPNREFSF